MKSISLKEKYKKNYVGGEEDEDYCDSWQELKIDVDFFNIC